MWEESNSRCLPAYLLKGELRTIAIKNEEGIILEECTMRLLIDTKGNRPVLFTESNYPKNAYRHDSILLEACKRRAKALGVPLVNEVRSELHSERYPDRISCLSGRKCFERVDAIHVRFQNQLMTYGYDIENSYVINLDSNKNPLAAVLQAGSEFNQ